MTGAEAEAARVAEAGYRHVWAVQGGSVACLLDAMERHPGLTVRYAIREIEAGYAVDGANRAAGEEVALAVVTTGPGLAQLIPAVDVADADACPLTGIYGGPRTGDEFQRQTVDVTGYDLFPLFMDDAEADATEYFPHRVGAFVRSRRVQTEPDEYFLAWVKRVLPDPVPGDWVEAIEEAASAVGPEDYVYADAGITLAMVYHVLHERLGHRLCLPYSQAPMGWAVAAATGGAEATGKRCWALVGDGSLEVQGTACTVARWYGSDVRVICLDSHGYSAIKRFQRPRGMREYGTRTRTAPVAHRIVDAPW